MSKHWRGIGSVAATGLLVLIAGCASWYSYDAARTLHRGQSLPYQMRATRSDSSRGRAHRTVRPVRQSVRPSTR